jgi:hypothetical protein
VLAGARLEPGDEQRSRDVAPLEGSADAQQVIPVLGDEVDLDVVAEQRAGPRPTLVVRGRMGSPELFLAEFGDAG